MYLRSALLLFALAFLNTTVAAAKLVVFAGKTRAYRNAIQLLYNRAQLISENAQSIPADQVIIRDLLQFAQNSSEWHDIDVNRLIIHLVYPESPWLWTEAYYALSKVFENRIWQTTVDFAANPRELRLRGSLLLFDYPNIPEADLQETLLLDYMDPQTKMTLVDRAIADHNEELMQQLVAAGSIVDESHSSHIMQFPSIQHLYLSSLEEIQSTHSNQRNTYLVIPQNQLPATSGAETHLDGLPEELSKLQKKTIFNLIISGSSKFIP
jgi:hypothetical protein